MHSATYEEFQNLLTTLKSKKETIQNQIEENTLQIIEARSFAKEILDREEEDFKVFSPRKIEDIYKDELEKSNVKQLNCEKENQSLITKREELDSVISILEKVSVELSQGSLASEVSEKQIDIDNIESDCIIDDDKNVLENHDTSNDTIEVMCDTVKKLTSLNYKIELSTKLIYQDPMRVKTELETVNKNITKIIEQLKIFTNEDI